MINAGDDHVSAATCRVPAGNLHRGSSASPDEQPEGTIALSEYQIDETPVTNRAFAEFIRDNGYRTPPLWTPAGWGFVQTHQLHQPNYWNDPLWSAPYVPVTGVSWWEALAFARWRGATLPTEAQWEYACKGRSNSTYPWGEDDPDPGLANYAPDGEPIERRPTRPDAFARNISEFGVRDLAGNFAEWCLDNYAVGYHVADQDPLYVTDESDHHVVRGGCGLHDEDYLRCSARDHYHPGLRDNLIGFRCASRTDEGAP